MQGEPLFWSDEPKLKPQFRFFNNSPTPQKKKKKKMVLVKNTVLAFSMQLHQEKNKTKQKKP